MTSIIEIQFDEDGTAYVLEVDENTWIGAEEGLGVGGTVNACRTSNGGGNGENDRRRDDDDDDDDDEGNGNGSVTWTCEAIATGLPFPTALAVQDDSIYVALLLDPQTFAFEVAKLTVSGDLDGDGDQNDDDDWPRPIGHNQARRAGSAPAPVAPPLPICPDCPVRGFAGRPPAR